MFKKHDKVGDDVYFNYSEEELLYLKRKDKKLAQVIDKIGYIKRETDTDLFSSVIHAIVGQQISTKAHRTIWQRIQNNYGQITPSILIKSTAQELQKMGISLRKAQYIMDFVRKVQSGQFVLADVQKADDEEAIAKLCSLKGIGRWTAEMILLFCLERKNIFSFNDLAIRRGLSMVYHHKNIDRNLFEKYRKRFNPYGSIASLYLWAVSSGAIPDMVDCRENKKAVKIKKSTASFEYMKYKYEYSSPIGKIILTSDGEKLTALCFDFDRYFSAKAKMAQYKDLEVFAQTVKWLDMYFKGEEPNFMPPIRLEGTEFRKRVWEILQTIPYGKVVSYGEIARKIAEKRKVPRVSAQAVGGAVGHNPISIIVPCHRVVGANGNLTGYGGGLDKKIALLKLEKVDMKNFFAPKK